MNRMVYVVTEGESYHNAWLPHAVFSNGEIAHDYAQKLIVANEVQRWANVTIWKFELDTVGPAEIQVLEIND